MFHMSNKYKSLKEIGNIREMHAVCKPTGMAPQLAWEEREALAEVIYEKTHRNNHQSVNGKKKDSFMKSKKENLNSHWNLKTEITVICSIRRDGGRIE